MGFHRSVADALAAASSLLWRTDCVACARLTTPSSTSFFHDATATPHVGGSIGAALCIHCAHMLAKAPERCTPPVSAIPLYSCGPYGGAHRAVVLAAKDHMRPVAARIIGRTMAGSLTYLSAGGQLPDPRLRPIAFLPAPTRRSAARQRGGDIVTRAATELAAHWPRSCVIPIAHLDEKSTDSVGLSRHRRRENIARHLQLNSAAVQKAQEFQRAGGAFILLDDVCTTGATLAQFALALRAVGVGATAALVMCAA